jgi:hypothetical protein
MDKGSCAKPLTFAPKIALLDRFLARSDCIIALDDGHAPYVKG